MRICNHHRLLFLLMATMSFLVACKKDNSDPIVLPPGTAVQYSNSEFLTLSQEFYTVELRKMNPTTGELDLVDELTPKENKGSLQNISYVIPKDKATSGLFVIQVDLARQNMFYSSFVVPGQVTKPSLASTIVVNLIS